MKKFILLCCSFLLGVQLLFGQIDNTDFYYNTTDTATTSGVSYMPVSTGSHISGWSRMLYLSSEVGGKTLYGIAFTSKEGPSKVLPNQKIYYKIVDYTDISDIGTTYINPTTDGATLVWEGDMPKMKKNTYPADSGWYHCNFKTPVVVPANKSLLIYYESKSGVSATSYTRATSITNRAQAYNNTKVVDFTSTTATGYKMPVTRFAKQPIYDGTTTYSDLGAAINACVAKGTDGDEFTLTVCGDANIGVEGLINKNITINVVSSDSGTQRTITRTANAGVINATAGTINLTDIILDGAKGSGRKATKAMVRVFNTGTIANIDNCIIKNCSTTTSGSAVNVSNATVNFINHKTIIGGSGTGNVASSGAGIYVQNSTVVNFYVAPEISYNTATASGGGIYQTAGTINVGTAETPVNLNINNNTAATYAGGIYKTGGTINCYGDLTISNCTQTGTGDSKGAAAIFLSTGTINAHGYMTIEACTTAGSYGGNMRMTGGTLHCYKDLKWKDNSCTNTYGGAFCKTDGTLTVDGKHIFQGNSAGTVGGACYTNTSLSNAEFTNNTAGTEGGAIYKYSTPNVTYTGCTFSGNTAGTNGGAICQNTASTVTVTNCTFKNNTATNNGGAIYVNSGTVTFSSTASTIGGVSTADKNSAKKGGGIYVSGGTVNFNVAPTIAYNEASEKGGGIYIAGGTVNSKAASNISYNSAAYSGGGICLVNGTLACSTAVASVNHNSATRGAGMTMEGGTLSFNGSDTLLRINENTGATYGGGLYFQSGTITGANHLTINQNSATTGGGVYCDSAETKTMGNLGTIWGNTATNGAGIAAVAGTLDITGTNTYLSNNTASTNGGGIYVSACTLNLAGATLSKNAANGTSNGQGGGGIFVNSGQFNFITSQTTIGGTSGNGNTATKDGGGIYAKGGEINFTVAPQISYNTATDSGGAIFVGYTGNVKIPAATTISYNSAKFGSGIAIRKGTITADGALTLDHNTSTVSSSKGGGLHIGANAVVTCNALLTVTNNSCKTNGGGIYQYDASTLNLYGGANISHNKGTYGGGYYGCQGTMQVGKSDDNKNIVFDHNTSAAWGGAFYQNNSSGTYSFYGNVTVSNNTVTDNNGGGLVFRQGTLTCTGDMTISGNSASAGAGGGLYKEAGSFTVNGTLTVNGNTASTDGGGIFFRSYNGDLGSYSVGSMSVSDNVADGNGGGIYTKLPMTFPSGMIVNNNKAANGGGIYKDSTSTITLNNATFTKDTATGNGGALYVNAGTVNFSTNASTIGGSGNGNQAKANGGGIYINGGTLNFNVASTISHNTAKTDGGGMVISSGTVTTNGILTVSNNTATRGGGIMLTSGSLTCNADLKVLNNTASSSYGGGMVNAGTITVGTALSPKNLIVGGNTATDSAGGIYNSGPFTCYGNLIDTSNTAGRH
ncbi:MAG: hypothetical protein J5606_00500, partial [Bacteroidales bacterium]|nr:hypothetical protein [Bacteroidales bacterium]